MSVFFNIEKALADAVDSLNLSCPVGKFGVELTDEEKGDGIWVQPHHMPGPVTPVTCGYNGENNHSGILQIDICYPIGQGSGILLKQADEIAKHFQSGDKVSYDGQVVNVRSCSLSLPIESGGFRKQFLTIVYYARSVRHT